MNELALFTGAGGGILGSRLLGWRVVCGVEIDPYCREVLLRRQEEGFLDPFPIWDDVRTFDGKPWRGKVDVVTAGFPCQPWSTIGLARGKDDPRNLWPDTYRIICEVRPSVAWLENVTGLLSHDYFGRILGALAEGGYDARWDCVPASAIGAPHPRDRVWIAAYPQGQRRPQFLRHIARSSAQTLWPQNSLDSRCDTLRRLEESLGEPAIFGNSPGRANIVDRLEALGAMQVPAVVRAAWMLLKGE